MQKPQISDGLVHDLITGIACCLSEYFKTGNCMKTEFQKTKHIKDWKPDNKKPTDHYHRQSRLKAENIAIFEKASNQFFFFQKKFKGPLCSGEMFIFMLIFDLEVGKCANMTISPFLAYVRNISKLHWWWNVFVGILNIFFFANLYHSFQNNKWKSH